MARLYHEDAELYDIAFDWDVTAEIEWLLERLDGPQRVLEPACGTGRMLTALAARGVEVVGFDLSPEMVQIAQRRLGSLGRVRVADMADFDLGEQFDGAVCPINTLGHLRPDELARHLQCVARHAPVYLVQVALHPFGRYESHWRTERNGVDLDVRWVPEDVDIERGTSRDRSRIEVLAGPRAGEVIEDVHAITIWTPERWAELVDASPFQEVAMYDGSEPGRPRVAPGTRGGLLWHELRTRSATRRRSGRGAASSPRSR
jgi:SAM-dependent methyltransferase